MVLGSAQKFSMIFDTAERKDKSEKFEEAVPLYLFACLLPHPRKYRGGQKKYTHLSIILDLTRPKLHLNLQLQS